MMSTIEPKSKRTANEPHQMQTSIQKAVKTKGSKKSSAAKSSESPELQEGIEPVESEAGTASKKRKIAKVKVIRDSFSFPEQDYLKISELKKTCLATGVHVKKSEILRAGLNLLSKLNLDELKQAVEEVEKVKTGRPNT